MQRRHCETGHALEADYTQKTLQWISAEANKRVAIGVATGVGALRWNEIARRVDDARVLHEEALDRYMDHVVACAVCHAHMFALTSSPANGRPATLLHFSTPTRIGSPH